MLQWKENEGGVIIKRFNSDEYYTASQAMERLGLSKGAFHRKVNAGQIRKVTPVGGKQGVYPKKDIDTLAQIMNLVFEKENKFEFSKSSIGEQREEMEIGIRCFGPEYITPLPERVSFQLQNDHTFWSLKVDGRVVGYLSMFRFPDVFLDDILAGRRIEREITLKEVLPFPRHEPFSIYIDVMAVDPIYNRHLRKFYAGEMISRFANALLNLRRMGYLIDILYTVSATPEGDNLIRGLGFQLMEGKSIEPSRIAYQFKLDEQGLKQVEHLKRFSRGV